MGLIVVFHKSQLFIDIDHWTCVQYHWNWKSYSFLLIYFFSHSSHQCAMIVLCIERKKYIISLYFYHFSHSINYFVKQWKHDTFFLYSKSSKEYHLPFSIDFYHKYDQFLLLVFILSSFISYFFFIHISRSYWLQFASWCAILTSSVYV